MSSWNEVEVGFEVVCSSRGAEDDFVSAHRFKERHPRVQGSSYPGDKRVFGIRIVRLAFQAKHNTCAVKAKRDKGRSNNLLRALAESRIFPERAGRVCFGCPFSTARECHFGRVWFASCAFQNNVLNRKPFASAPAAVQPHGNPFELTHEPESLLHFISKAGASVNH